METAVSLCGGLLGLVAAKRFYETVIRKDVSADPSTKPVLGKLSIPLHASHRGGSRCFPENTLIAFQNAVQWRDGRGALRRTHMIEFDVQLTKDKQLVIMHNQTVEGTTDGVGRVADFTLTDIRKLDAGYRFTPDNGYTYPYRGQGIMVPTLREILSTFVPVPDLIFYLDFKSADAVPSALEMVEEFGIEDRIILGAVPRSANRMVLKLKPPCVPVTPDIASMILMYILHLTGLLWIYPMEHEIVGTTVHRWGFKVLNKRMVRAFQNRQRLVAVFGDDLNHIEGQLDCLVMGVDILVTDRPDLLHKAMDLWRGEKIATTF